MSNNEQENRISQAIVSRLPRYLRYLTELETDGVERISSRELSSIMRVTASQLRQDLNNFGGFGQQGYGYNVSYLRDEIAKLLGMNDEHFLVIIGGGRFGKILAKNMNFNNSGFVLKGIFDNDEAVIGTDIDGHIVMSMDKLSDFVRENRIEIAVLTIPKESAKAVANGLCRTGISGIWNFSHTDLDMPDNIQVENVHLSDSLMRLSYRINEYRKNHAG
ncbi:MAG: redox-sensing transcriptional repressor Rex [Lachnospiraceae bacterium]|nr:redox-sensing transcriptional repressor Rex [Lachnospiraceae bacterium]